MAVAELSRTDDYLARLDQYVERLPAEQRAQFLERTRTMWLSDYDRFCNDVDSGRPRPNETAFDYICTIAEIGKRIEQEKSHG